MLKTIKLAALSLAIMTNTSNAADNQLSEQEQQAGWELLFNGKDMSQWRNYKSEQLNKKWQIDNNTMSLTARGGGDILTKKAYKNFELQLEWKISSAGNSGIFVLVDELGQAIYSHAPEVQILDNERHSDNKVDSHLSGSLYDLVSSPKASHKPAEQWNQVTIKLVDGHLQVWQNGVSTASIVIGSTTWNNLVKSSKFATWQGFAQGKSGHIGLQDHGDKVWFKNIKIREL
ncbi:3-keto-disaccharide hydrolase [Thalassotalea marina]|uniref:Glycosyl hydrolase n=1 Tax=Thalassotalea marina TaxID=1673741 RepID=A0A919EKH4_9GAMM|nr:DUF1080 domain-containing protein [Thalassotalea marina]GHF92059.1 glycosyl hydrolase [Thalassotalea marina]